MECGALLFENSKTHQSRSAPCAICWMNCRASSHQKGRFLKNHSRSSPSRTCAWVERMIAAGAKSQQQCTNTLLRTIPKMFERWMIDDGVI